MKQGRNSKRPFLFVFFFSVLSPLSMLSLQEIRFEENGHSNLSDRLSPKRLEELSAVEKGKSLFDLRPTEIEQKLTAGEPLIEWVEIRREIPGRLFIRYQVRSAKALAVEGNEYWLVDESANLFTKAAPSERLDLPVVPKRNVAEALEWLKALQGSFEDLKDFKIHQIGENKARFSAYIERLSEKDSPHRFFWVHLPTHPTPEHVSRLKESILYLIKNKMLVSALDLRFGKKVVVNTGISPTI